jgi:hypothetical protein
MPVCGDDPAWIISIGEYAVWVSNLRGIGLTVTMVQYPGWLDALYAFSEVPVDALPEEPHIVPLRSPGQADVESEGEEVQ